MPTQIMYEPTSSVICTARPGRVLSDAGTYFVWTWMDETGEDMVVDCQNKHVICIVKNHVNKCK